MNCTICKKSFILSKDKNDYQFKKNVLEYKMSKYIDDYFYKNELKCWDQVLHWESLLLEPGKLPKKCKSDDCNAYICGYCYTHSNSKKIMCNDCETLEQVKITNNK